MVTGTQHSSADIAGLVPPPEKKSRRDNNEAKSDEEIDNANTQQGPVVPISEAAVAFLEALFNTKLDNNSRKAKAKANGTPDSCWIQCAKLDPAVAVNVSPAAQTQDIASTRIQNFWLDAAILLIFLLEKAEELELLSEGIQTSMGNATYQHSMDRRHALMIHLNPKLK